MSFAAVQKHVAVLERAGAVEKRLPRSRAAVAWQRPRSAMMTCPSAISKP